MTADEKSDWSLIDFARKLAVIPQTGPLAGFNFPEPAAGDGALAAAPKAANEDDTIPKIPPKNYAPTAALQNAHASQVIAPGALGKKQLKTPGEIATMIMAALRSIDNCPDRGLIVTVYGSNPWNALLTIRPEAGSSIDRSLWFSRVQEIGMRLREDFDIIEEQPQ
jgi:hypothetical protein